jgi:hypothetical protein
MEYYWNNFTEEDIIKILEDNKYAMASELSPILKVDPDTIRNWRKRFGIPCLVKVNTKFFKKQEIKRIEHPKVTDQKIWDNKEWFEEHYNEKRLGTKTISKIIDRHHRTVEQRLRKYGIQIRSLAESRRSTNPCCNKEWLKRHYEELGWSQRKCGDAAGVSPYTIVKWLNKFGIHVRDSSEAHTGRLNHFYGKKLNAQKYRKRRSVKRWKLPHELAIEKNRKRTKR